MRFVYCLALFVALVAAKGLRADAPQVKVDFYFESYCPSCSLFIESSISSWKENKDIVAITDLHLYPFGNGKIVTRDPPTFQCQHGEKECYGNMVEDCAIAHYPENYLDFIICIEEVVDFSDDAVKFCAKEAKIDGENLLTCATGTEGPLLHLAAADATPADHQYVPWLVVNDEVVLSPTRKSLINLVCEAYTGEKPAGCNKYVAPQSNKVDAEKVPVELYFESYCPGCEETIKGPLNDFVKVPELAAIADIKLYPFGNGKIVTRDPPTFQCQHGEKECYGNMVENCAIAHNPDNWWNFILCEESVVDFSDDAIKQCATKANIDAEAILTCIKSTEGPLLHLAAADATPADHEWVPWLIINGEVVDDIDNLKTFICNAYKGEKPSACLESLNNVNVAEKVPVELYFESYCPGCEETIEGPLNDFVSVPELAAIADIKLYPFGNGRILTRDPPTFQCQHGEKECYGNMVENCAIAHNPDNWWNFILCEESVVDFSDDAIKQCATKANIDAEAIITCTKGTEGPLLHLAAADATPADHEWVPWLIINGEVVEDTDELKSAICNAYKGEKPAACYKTLATAVAVEKVPVQLFYESYCPGCEQTIKGPLNDFVSVPELAAIADIKLYPSGNALILTRDPPTFQCQHGEKECYGNMIESCAMAHNPDNWWSFILCEENVVDFSDEAVKECATKSNIDAETIIACANGTEGPLLHLAAADATPSHYWVPWLIVDGKVVDKIAELKTAICDAYTGEKPAACN
ncbi:hypothetical protein WA158_006200 [Blastocystis sp. Blastoise]